MSKLLFHSYRWRYGKLNNRSIILKGPYLSIPQFNKTRLFSQEHVEVETDIVHEHDKFIPFLQRVGLRRSEARRSLLVQVQSTLSYKELHTYCSSYGTVNQMFHYTTGVEPLHFILVEFANELGVKELLKNSSTLDETLAVPTHSHFVWFRASNRKLGKLKLSKTARLAVENGTRINTDDEINDILRKCESISDQMRKLHSVTKLNDIGTRLRYLTSLQIEDMVSGMFPSAVAYPFGSSVNGYGKMGCDLDLVLRLANKNTEESRLIFHCKAGIGSERTMSQRHIEVLGDMIHLFLPGCAQVRRILQARIPIIKYHQHLTNIECDLSMTNMSGVHMSDFLYLTGELDDRVRPLVFTIRKWASAVGLTNFSPGRWITNFSITLLVLAFLQRPLSANPLLPSLNSLVKLAGTNDRHVTEDGIDCTFLRNLNHYNHKTQNTDSLESLLREFFEYYAQFDFSTKAVCLNEAIALTKPEHSPMYIVNPLERGLNVSKNVSMEEVERFQKEVKNAAWLLESQDSNLGNWGLLGLFNSKKTMYNVPKTGKFGRMMEVSTLFEGEEEFKNPVVEQEIVNIRKSTREKIKSLKSNIMEGKSQR